MVALFPASAFGAGVWFAGNIINKRQAEQLRQFDKDLPGAKKDVADANVRAEGFRLEIARTNDSAAKSQERAAELESSLLKLRKETEPRRLSGAQKEHLVRLLAGHPTPIGIVSRLIDTGASDFADDFDESLKNAHWQTLRIKNRISSKYGVSIWFVSKIAPNSTPELKILDETLTRSAYRTKSPNLRLETRR